MCPRCGSATLSVLDVMVQMHQPINARTRAYKWPPEQGRDARIERLICDKCHYVGFLSEFEGSDR